MVRRGRMHTCSSDMWRCASSSAAPWPTASPFSAAAAACARRGDLAADGKRSASSVALSAASASTRARRASASCHCSSSCSFAPQLRLQNQRQSRKAVPVPIP